MSLNFEISSTSHGELFLGLFRQIFISLAFEKPKKDYNVLKITLIQGFCPLKVEMLDLLSDFVLSIFF